MSTEKKFYVSFGIVSLVLAHAILNAFALRVPVQGLDTSRQAAQSYTFDTIEGGLSSQSKVNAVARDEVKKDTCTTCTQSRIRPAVVRPYVQPFISPAPPVTPASVPQPARPVAPAKVTESTKNNIDIYVSSDAQSQQLLNWFNNDPQLVALKNKCNFQAFGPGNALYKTRYASVVPESSFPAIVFTKPTGGHIYIASRDQIPTTATGLLSEMRSAYALATQAEKPSPPPSITPVSMMSDLPSFATMDCPDGSCDVNRRPLLPMLPSNRDVSPLFPQRNDADLVATFFRQGYSMESIILVGLILLVVIMWLRK